RDGAQHAERARLFVRHAFPPFIRDSPDESRSGVNIRASLPGRQSIREAQTACAAAPASHPRGSRELLPNPAPPRERGRWRRRQNDALKRPNLNELQTNSLRKRTGNFFDRAGKFPTRTGNFGEQGPILRAILPSRRARNGSSANRPRPRREGLPTARIGSKCAYPEGPDGRMTKRSELTVHRRLRQGARQ